MIICKTHDIYCELKKKVKYDPVSGVFTRIFKYKNKIIGGLGNNGYLNINIKGTYYLAHRLAWLYMTGNWPNGYIDHINGNTLDNRWENLRVAKHEENLRNSKLNKRNLIGLKGVSNKKNGTFSSRIVKNGRPYYLGTFNSPEEAHQAYVEAARNLHGEFARSR